MRYTYSSRVDRVIQQWPYELAKDRLKKIEYWEATNFNVLPNFTLGLYHNPHFS